MSEDNGSANQTTNTQKKYKMRRKSAQEMESSDEEASVTRNLQEIKLRQKFRERSNGLNALSLISGLKADANEETDTNTDEQKNAKNQGGLVNMKALKSGKPTEISESFDVGIGSRFSVETNKCDEDEEMMKYIEKELKKIKSSRNMDELMVGDKQQQQQKRSRDPTIDILHKYITPEEAALMSLPDHLKESFSHRSEEMLSNQMLNGIPEVDLGIDVKIRNIEETEEAKHKLFKQRKYKRDMPSQFVPNNMAVNFVQHNRYNMANARMKIRRQRQINEKSASNTATKSDGAEREALSANKVKRATDDYYYDKFRKQFRRY